ncbi:hypothetical protein EZV62_018354 [Acer yangbiense]|uniref:Uncharacterized protein n=1 Tax=Acer yangbiense TaxID=1000413 RepID=A0A5C7HJ61_9ROSI|nr:hypothetical protein EZV62_018354 [Acer yangbiense]
MKMKMICFVAEAEGKASITASAKSVMKEELGDSSYTFLAKLNKDFIIVWLQPFHRPNSTNGKIRTSEVQFGFSDLQRTNLELDSYKEKIKENQEKIKLNKQLPYLVGNIVEVKL